MEKPIWEYERLYGYGYVSKGKKTIERMRKERKRKKGGRRR